MDRIPLADYEFRVLSDFTRLEVGDLIAYCQYENRWETVADIDLDGNNIVETIANRIPVVQVYYFITNNTDYGFDQPNSVEFNAWNYLTSSRNYILDNWDYF